MKLLKKISLGVVVVFVAMQFFSPTKNIAAGNHTEAFIKQTNPSLELKSLFKTSCSWALKRSLTSSLLFNFDFISIPVVRNFYRYSLISLALCRIEILQVLIFHP